MRENRGKGNAERETELGRVVCRGRSVGKIVACRAQTNHLEENNSSLEGVVQQRIENNMAVPYGIYTYAFFDPKKRYLT
jgi:hypothetical protein